MNVSAGRLKNRTRQNTAKQDRSKRQEDGDIMSELPNDNSNGSPSFLPLLGIVLGTVVFIVLFVLLLYALYVWLGPWIASMLVVLLLAASFYAAYRFFWQRLGQTEEPSAENEVEV
jgi:1,4-dihydroxy-2-naphthoate octaprenyltransferase